MKEVSNICTSFVRASASATTGAPGAKASARAKRCGGHSYVGVALWPTGNPDGWWYKISSWEGEDISISKHVYADPATSHGYADNGLHIATAWYP